MGNHRGWCRNPRIVAVICCYRGRNFQNRAERGGTQQPGSRGPNVLNSLLPPQIPGPHWPSPAGGWGGD